MPEIPAELRRQALQDLLYFEEAIWIGVMCARCYRRFAPDEARVRISARLEQGLRHEVCPA